MRPGWVVLAMLVGCAHQAPHLVPPVTTAPVTIAPPAPRDPSMVRPCARDSQTDEDAHAKLEELRVRIHALAATDDPEPVAREIRALATAPCWALAFEDADLSWMSAPSLKAWWEEGGYEWLWHYHLFSNLFSTKPSVSTAPTPRLLLTTDTSPDHPLSSLLCPTKALDDRSCGTETTGWLLRANAAFARRSLARGEGASAYCARATSYPAFRRCLDDVAATGERLPLGAFRAPKEGWVIETHGAFIRTCEEELRIYDLATGAAYDFGCDHFGEPPKLRVGRVSVAALREAAWMAMLTTVAEKDVRVRTESFEVPPHIVIERRHGEPAPEWPRTTVVTDDCSVDTWSWLRPKDSQHWTVRNCDTAAGAHASELLAVARASFEVGCAPAPPPRAIPWEKLGDVYVQYPKARAALAALVSVRPCSAVP